MLTPAMCEKSLIRETAMYAGCILSSLQRNPKHKCHGYLWLSSKGLHRLYSLIFSKRESIRFFL